MTTADPLAVEPTVTWCRAQPALWRRTLDGVVVLAAHATEPVALSGPAAGIWDLLAEPMTQVDLVAALATRYQTPDERVAGEVGGALDALLELGALCRV